jgi:sulfatase maturation enzyme AslB (radical SAM superfamily)
MDINHVIYAVPKVPEEVPSEKRIDWVAGNLKKFCTLPWLNLNTNPNGNVKLCCSIAMDHFVADDTDRPFNLGHDDIETIWNSYYMQNVRNLHRQNNGSKDCHDCYSIEKVSGHSPRKGQNILWINRKTKDSELNDHLINVSNEELYSQVGMLPVSLELRLGNQCNLKCVTCWGMSSSLIQDERKEMLHSGLLLKNNLGWIHNKWQEEVDMVDKADVTEWYETETFYNNFKKMAPKLRRLYTTGGEPTLIKANYRMLEELVAAGNTDCRIEFTSNMTTMNPKFYENLSKFENVEIQMSIDGVEEIGEYIRYGTEWEKVKENVYKVANMASTRPNWRIVCYTVLQALNYQYLTGIWEFLSDVAFESAKPIDWWPITLNHPPYLGLSVIPLEERQRALPRIVQEAKKYEVGKGSFGLGNDALQALTDSIQNMPYDERMGNQFTSYKKFLDSYRASRNG